MKLEVMLMLLMHIFDDLSALPLKEDGVSALLSDRRRVGCEQDPYLADVISCRICIFCI